MSLYGPLDRQAVLLSKRLRSGARYGGTRAQRLLAVAAPKSQAERLAALLGATSAAVTVVNL